MFSRRDFIASGAATLAVALPCPASAMRAVSSYLDPELLDRARWALLAKRRHIKHSDVFAIADFGQASRTERFHLVHVESGRIESFHVAHGRGSDPRHRGFVDHFSNEPGSAASSAGAYITADLYDGKYGRSMRLSGLDPTNSNAQIRDIVMHAAPYAEDAMIDRFGKLGRSEGCFALSQVSLNAVLDRIGAGRLLYCDKV